LESIRTIDELPFRERPPLEVLNLDHHRDAPDLEATVFGWAHVDQLWLVDRDGAAGAVERALVLAVHAAEEPEELGDDVELEFFVEEVAKDYSVTVLLSAFLARWLPRVTGGGERAIVLAMCNPHRARIPRPSSVAPGTPVHYAFGDVDSWLETGAAGRQRLRLVADAWQTAE
jgi:hypothetical protein